MLVSVVFFMLLHSLGICAWLWILLFFVVGFTSCILGTRLSIQFQHVSVEISISLNVVCCCHGFFVVVIVDRVLIFVGDRHGFSQPDTNLQCQGVCARVGDFFFGVRLICGIRVILF